MASPFIAADLGRSFHLLTQAHPCLHTAREGVADPPLAFLSYLDPKTRGLGPLWGGQKQSPAMAEEVPCLNPSSCGKVQGCK